MRSYITYGDYQNHIKVCEFLNRKPVYPYDKIHKVIIEVLPSLKIKEDEIFNYKLLFYKDKDIYLKMDVSGDYLIIMPIFDRHLNIPEIPWIHRSDFYKKIIEHYFSMKFAAATISRSSEDIYSG